MQFTGADPALVIGGGTNSLGRHADPIYFIDFLKNPMKLKKFWSIGGHMLGFPPLSATDLSQGTCLLIMALKGMFSKRMPHLHVHNYEIKER